MILVRNIKDSESRGLRTEVRILNYKPIRFSYTLRSRYPNFIADSKSSTTNEKESIGKIFPIFSGDRI